MSKSFRVLAVCAASTLALGGIVASPMTQATGADMAPLNVGKANAVDGSYIVVMKKDTGKMGTMAAASASVAKVAQDKGAKEVTTLSGLGMVTAKMDKSALDAVRKDPAVAYIDQDVIVGLNDAETKGVEAKGKQTGATWGLDRLDQASLPLNQTYNYTYTGRGVNAYIIDTGVYNHSDYSSRLGSYYNATDESGSNWLDPNGHGTHVAGTIGGSTYGVAKQVTINGVRVLRSDGKAPVSMVVKGMDWVVQNARKPAVANMSLGGSKVSSQDEAVNRMVNSGIVLAVAAGNETANACNTSPGGAPAAITVGSTDKNDRLSDFSNYGSCVDILAPGSGITSSWKGGGTNTISGTSMATPHVVGVLAQVLEANPSYNQSQAQSAMNSVAVRGKISAVNGSPNLLLQTYTKGGNPNPDPDPGQPDPGQPDPQPNPGGNEFSNNSPQAIRDYGTAKSEINSTYRNGKKLTLSINIDHTCSQNLEITVQSPDGSRNVVKKAEYASSSSCDRWSGVRSDSFDMRSKTDGRWVIEVRDTQSGNTGTLKGWSVKFS